MIKRVVLGISGGVDSAVAGFLLKRRGFDVVGVFMRNWDEKDEVGNCLADKEAEDAEWICKKLGIPFKEVNFVKDYWTEVFSYLLDEYQNGRTPNPDIYCNRQIKFSKFLDYALNIEEADAIATGHYARSSYGDFLEFHDPKRGLRLLQALDRRKDQTFFLSQVQQSALQYTMFPVGSLMKLDVRKIASEEGLHKVATKVDSRGICFIGKRNFANFISEYIVDKPGPFIDIDTNEVVGEHRGLHHWTLGQGAKLPGLPWKYFISEKDLKNNSIYVARGTHHPSLFCSELMVEPFHWIHKQPSNLEDPAIQFDLHFRFQHGKPLVGCSVSPLQRSGRDSPSSASHYLITLEVPQRAVTPGQFAVLYKGDECLGSAKITNHGPTAFITNSSHTIEPIATLDDPLNEGLKSSF